MVDDSGSQLSTSLQQGEEIQFVTAEVKAARKRQYYVKRDASKVYLLDQHTR